MKPKHTPGPWRVVRANPSPTSGEWMISGSKPGYLAEVRDCGSGDVQANARLIAAAPELLAACEAAARLAWEVGCETVDGEKFLCPDGRGDLYRQITAALLKAGALSEAP